MNIWLLIIVMILAVIWGLNAPNLITALIGGAIIGGIAAYIDINFLSKD